MEGKEEALYPQVSLRRVNLPASSPFHKERPTGHLLLLRDGEDFYKLPNQTHSSHRPEAFPTQGQPLPSASGIPKHCCQYFGYDHSLGVKAADSKDGVSHVRLRPMYSQKVLNGTHCAFEMRTATQWKHCFSHLPRDTGVPETRRVSA